MMDFGKMLGDAEAMKRFGNTVVQWDLHTRQPKKVFDIPGAPREIRCAWKEQYDYSFTSTALTSKIWLIYADDKTRRFDISDPFHPKQVFEQKIGAQVNMVSSSWDGKRLYYTSSLLANWDKKSADNEQFFKAYSWKLTEQFSIDFNKEKLGRAHQMRFGTYSLDGKAAK